MVGNAWRKIHALQQTLQGFRAISVAIPIIFLLTLPHFNPIKLIGLFHTGHHELPAAAQECRWGLEQEPQAETLSSDGAMGGKKKDPDGDPPPSETALPAGPFGLTQKCNLRVFPEACEAKGSGVTNTQSI